MRLKGKYAKYWSLIKKHLNTPIKIFVFISMFLWGSIIQLLLLFFPIRIVTKWVTRFIWMRKSYVPHDDIARYISWLKQLRLINSHGDCIALSLLYYRFLSMRGEKPTLFIGFNDNEGHAWVEVLGEVVSEASDVSRKFTPTLELPAGQSKFIPVK